MLMVFLAAEAKLEFVDIVAYRQVVEAAACGWTDPGRAGKSRCVKRIRWRQNYGRMGRMDPLGRACECPAQLAGSCLQAAVLALIPTLIIVVLPNARAGSETRNAFGTLCNHGSGKSDDKKQQNHGGSCAISTHVHNGPQSGAVETSGESGAFLTSPPLKGIRHWNNRRQSCCQLWFSVPIRCVKELAAQRKHKKA
jgi:hypothetical protein